MPNEHDPAAQLAKQIDPAMSATQAAELKEAIPIPVSGKNSETIAKLAALPSPHIQMREVEFHFKTPRSDKKNDEGKPIDELGKVLEKRPTIKLALPFPTWAGFVESLSDEKIATFVLDLVEEAIIAQARDQVGDDTTPVNEQSELDLSKLTLGYLANQPKAERRGGGIAKEVWEDFVKDYVEVMPALTKKSPEVVGNAAKFFLAKFQPIKTQKKVIVYLREQLALWFANSPKAEEFQEVYDFLEKKAEAFLNADEASLLNNL